jgi:F-type H+-transporting ATPase subunit b
MLNVLAQQEGIELLPETPELIWGFVAFALLMALMFKLVFPKLNQTLEERQGAIQGQLEEAERTRLQAEELRRQYEQQLADAQARAEEILEEARAQADQIRREAASRGDDEAQIILSRARDDAEAERGRLVSELRGQVAALSVELAGKIVQKEIDANQHRALVDQYINELSGLN